MHKVWVSSLVLLVSWQALVLLAVLFLPAEFTVWAALASGLVFGSALLSVFYVAQKNARKHADHIVLHALNELDSVRRRASKDDMTGLNNRAYMYERLIEGTPAQCCYWTSMPVDYRRVQPWMTRSGTVFKVVKWSASPSLVNSRANKERVALQLHL